MPQRSEAESAHDSQMSLRLHLEALLLRSHSSLAGLLEQQMSRQEKLIRELLQGHGRNGPGEQASFEFPSVADPMTSCAMTDESLLFGKPLRQPPLGNGAVEDLHGNWHLGAQQRKTRFAVEASAPTAPAAGAERQPGQDPTAQARADRPETGEGAEGEAGGDRGRNGAPRDVRGPESSIVSRGPPEEDRVRLVANAAVIGAESPVAGRGLPEPERVRIATKARISSYLASDLTETEKISRRRAKQAEKYIKKLFDRRTHFTKEERFNLGDFIRSDYFERLSCFITVTNLVLFGVEVQSMAVNMKLEPPFFLFVVMQTYTVLFLIELLLRLYAHGRDCFNRDQRFWNLLDLIVVLSSIVEFALDVADYNNPENDPQNLAYMRVLRISRSVRIFRVIRVTRFSASLRTLVQSILSTLGSLMQTIFLLLVVVYVFGVACTQSAMDGLIRHLLGTNQTMDMRSHCNGVNSQMMICKTWEHYGDLGRSMFTLFKSTTNGIDWQEAYEPLEEFSFSSCVLFILYFTFTYFAVLNVVTGVFCQNAIESAERDHEVNMQKQIARKDCFVNELKNLFRTMDHGNRGTLTVTEFEDGLENPKVQAYFHSMDITTHEAWSLFKLLDVGGSHMIELDNFVAGCLQLRGTARNFDIAMLRYECRFIIERLSVFMPYVDQQLKSVRTDFQNIVGMANANTMARPLATTTSTS